MESFLKEVDDIQKYLGVYCRYKAESPMDCMEERNIIYDKLKERYPNEYYKWMNENG